MSELDDAKARLTQAITSLVYLRTHIEIIHDLGYLGAGKSSDGGRSARYHYYGDEVGDVKWRSLWRATRAWLGLGQRRDRYTELVALATGLERMLTAGPPLTAEEFNALERRKDTP